MGHYDPTLWCQLCTVVDKAILRFLDLLHLEHDFVIGRHCTVVCGDVGGCGCGLKLNGSNISLQQEK